ncbi:secretory calcium-binding phosphoprotein 5 [Diretmus argenteus]
MKLAILCLCLASTVSAAPSFFHYLPHYGGRQPAPPTQSYPSQGFIKYSLPNAPGRKSVEIYYPYDFTQQRMMPNIPNLPQIPNVPTFDANPPQSQDPLQPALQDQPTQTSQV